MIVAKANQPLRFELRKGRRREFLEMENTNSGSCLDCGGMVKPHRTEFFLGFCETCGTVGLVIAEKDGCPYEAYSIEGVADWATRNDVPPADLGDDEIPF